MYSNISWYIIYSATYYSRPLRLCRHHRLALVVSHHVLRSPQRCHRFGLGIEVEAALSIKVYHPAACNASFVSSEGEHREGNLSHVRFAKVMSGKHAYLELEH